MGVLVSGKYGSLLLGDPWKQESTMGGGFVRGTPFSWKPPPSFNRALASGPFLHKDS